MRNLLINLAGGLTGAVVLTLLHETVRRLDADAPRLDLIGEEGVNKMLEGAGADPLKGGALYAATLSGDLLANGMYYSVIGQAKDDKLLLRGTVAGLAAGWGALSLTGRSGLNDDPVTRTQKSRMLTLGYYLLGGIAAALTIKALRRTNHPFD